jgi:hypothetical protein
MTGNPKCGFCFGAWSSMDRWFMQPCVCKSRCDEPKCKAGAAQPEKEKR